MGRGWILLVMMTFGCGRPPFVVVTVEDPDGVAPGFELIAAGHELDKLGTTRPTRHEFPLVVTVEGSRSGKRSLWVEARDGSGHALGRGQAEATFATKGYPTATVRLSKACGADVDCRDASYCNGEETCHEGICNLTPSVIPCRSSVSCVTSSCLELGDGAGACDVSVSHESCAAGDYCNPVVGCLAGTGCYEDADCDDGYLCNGSERCVGFLCLAGEVPSNDDNDDCTADGCNETDGVFHLALAAYDGNACVKAGGGREICLSSQGGCVVSRCGDGFVDSELVPPETCDDGVENATSWAPSRSCNATCSGWAPFCGDGMVTTPEFCDDGNNRSDGNDCDAACNCEGMACAELVWQGVGGSDFGPWTTALTWDSNVCAGIGGVLPSVSPIAFLREGNGAVHLASFEELAEGVSLVLRQWTGSSFDPTLATPVPPATTWQFVPNLVSSPVFYGSCAAGEVCVGRWDGTIWAEVGTGSMGAGGISNTAATSSQPYLSYRASNDIVAAWIEAVGTGSSIYVRRYDGTTWNEVGAGSASGSGVVSFTASEYSISATLVRDSLGSPVLIWQAPYGTQAEIYALRWDGAAWVTIGTGSASGGGISNTSAYSRSPRAVVDSNGRIYVAWTEVISLKGEIYAKRWDGTAWGSVGVGSASGGGLSGTADHSELSAIILDADEQPVVFWRETLSGGAATYVLRFDGVQWQEVGTGSAQGRGVTGISIASGAIPALDPSGALHLAWRGDDAILGLLFDGSAWRPHMQGNVTEPSALATPGGSSSPTVVLDEQARPLVAWTEKTLGGNRIYVARYDGAAWQEVGVGSASGDGISGVAMFAANPKIVLDGLGRPVVAWEAGQVYIKRWSGSAWTEVGTGSASGGGISNSAHTAHSAAIVAVGSEELYVAWFDYGWNYNGDVYVKHWTGSAWVELGAHSASQGGVSNEQGYTNDRVSIAVDSNGWPIVAWDSWFTDEIFMLRWNGAAWVEVSDGSAQGGGVSYTGGRSTAPALTVAPDDTIYVAWQDDFLDYYSAYVWAFDGVAWQLVAEAGRENGSVSDPQSKVASVRLAADGLGRPFVAWQQGEYGHTEVALRRWNRDAWVDAGFRSGSGAGISNAACGSSSPALAVRGQTACVAWAEDAIGDIVVRCITWP